MLPEVVVYLYLLLLFLLLDSKQFELAVTCGRQLMEVISLENRRTLDLLAARAYFYYLRAFELHTPAQMPLIRQFLLGRLRSCTLHNDAEGQAVVVNLLVRSYISCRLYEQAEKLVSKVTFPESASNAQCARWLYYTGRMKAVSLEYGVAHRHLMNALRKAPQANTLAVGFKQTVHKFSLVVQLLLGQIPDRATFRVPFLKTSLAPYLKLTHAVREGSLRDFSEAVQMHEAQFIADGTYSLISRLRHNVIKAGIRLISLSYSRISLDAVGAKLQLENVGDAEFIVAKAIRDGVIEAEINHEGGYLRSRSQADVYATWEAAGALQDRTRYCLQLGKTCVKAMRFPPRRYNDQFETAEERRMREQLELDTARDLSDDFDDLL